LERMREASYTVRDALHPQMKRSNQEDIFASW
jgi:hypothetical protein